MTMNSIHYDSNFLLDVLFFLRKKEAGEFSGSLIATNYWITIGKFFISWLGNVANIWKVKEKFRLLGKNGQMKLWNGSKINKPWKCFGKRS